MRRFPRPEDQPAIQVRVLRYISAALCTALWKSGGWPSAIEGVRPL